VYRKQGRFLPGFRTRTKDPLGLAPKTTTFVAVTSRSWRDRDDWLKLRRRQKKWAGVRAIDADDLVTWLERAPSVYLWISEQLGREPRDVRPPDAWWDRWISQTRVVLPRGFLLAGRDGVVTQIRGRTRPGPAADHCCRSVPGGGACAAGERTGLGALWPWIGGHLLTIGRQGQRRIDRELAGSQAKAGKERKCSSPPPLGSRVTP